MPLSKSDKAELKAKLESIRTLLTDALVIMESLEDSELEAEEVTDIYYGLDVALDAIDPALGWLKTVKESQK